jgi:hypothetical protein
VGPRRCDDDGDGKCVVGEVILRIRETTIVGDSYEGSLIQVLNAIDPNAAEHLDRVDELPGAATASVVEKLLSFSCQAQHVGNIQAGRNGLLKIPHSRMSCVLKAAVSRVLDRTDEWEYRRLCELLALLDSDLLKEYVIAGLASPYAEVREAAEEFGTK